MVLLRYVKLEKVSDKYTAITLCAMMAFFLALLIAAPEGAKYEEYVDDDTDTRVYLGRERILVYHNDTLILNQPR